MSLCVCVCAYVGLCVSVDVRCLFLCTECVCGCVVSTCVYEERSACTRARGVRLRAIRLWVCARVHVCHLYVWCACVPMCVVCVVRVCVCVCVESPPALRLGRALLP